MPMRWRIMAAGALALAGCSTGRAPDTLLAAITQTAPRQCPADRVQNPPRGGGESERVGISEIELARTPLSGERGTLRLRRLDVAPGGVLPWHEHSTRQGMAIIIAGAMTEYRNDCSEPLVYGVGDIAREDAATAHYWRNEGRAPAAILASDVLP